MATNNAFKVTKDISARKGTRVGSTQSNVEAAAMRESHEYFVSRLTESYSKQLETMEQEYEEQIRDLKARIASDVENAKQDTVANMKTEAGGLLRAAENLLKQTQDELVQATNERDYQKSCASRAEKEKNTLETRYRNKIVQMSAKHKKQLDEAHREKNMGVSVDGDQVHQEVQVQDGGAKFRCQKRIGKVQRAGSGGSELEDDARLSFRVQGNCSHGLGRDIGRGEWLVVPLSGGRVVGSSC